jgi:hypothetical protein
MKSYLEDLLIFKIEEAKLPAPKRNYIFHHVRKWELDLAFPELKLAVEVEGAVWTRGRHTRGGGFIEDCDKYNEAAFLGWRVLRVTRFHIENGKAIEWIRRALEQYAGYTLYDYLEFENDGE